MSNLTGVTADARKRIEAAAPQPFDLHAPCIVCGERAAHQHAVALGKASQVTVRTSVRGA